MDVGSGGWDREGRPSEVRLDRLLVLDPAAIRREGAALDQAIFEQVVAAARASTTRCRSPRRTCRGFPELVVPRKPRHVQISPVDRGNLQNVAAIRFTAALATAESSGRSAGEATRTTTLR